MQTEQKKDGHETVLSLDQSSGVIHSLPIKPTSYNVISDFPDHATFREKGANIWNSLTPEAEVMENWSQRDTYSHVGDQVRWDLRCLKSFVTVNEIVRCAHKKPKLISIQL